MQPLLRGDEDGQGFAFRPIGRHHKPVGNNHGDRAALRSCRYIYEALRDGAERLERLPAET